MRRRSSFGLAVAAALLLWCSACAGILAENVREDGQTDKIRVGTGDKWSTWDRNSTKQNESLLLLKKESTF